VSYLGRHRAFCGCSDHLEGRPRGTPPPQTESSATSPGLLERSKELVAARGIECAVSASDENLDESEASFTCRTSAAIERFAVARIILKGDLEGGRGTTRERRLALV
jgi:hypothetical protein